MKGLIKFMTVAAAVAVTAGASADVAQRLATRADSRPANRVATERAGMPARTDLRPAAMRSFQQVPVANTRSPRRATAAEAGDVPVLYGTVTQAGYNSPTRNNWGVYEIPTSDAAQFELVAPDIEAKYSATLIGTYLYVPEQEDVDFFGTFYSVSRYDIDDEYARTNNSVSNDHFKARCTAPDPTEEGICYGCFYNGNAGYNFSKVNYATRQETVIKAIGTQWQVCGINAAGELYAVDSQKRLYSVDKSTGDQTLVATLTGINLSGWNAGCFDLKTGVMYMTTSSSYTGAKGGLYALDVSSGELTLIREFTDGEVLTSLFIPVSNIPANAPAAASGLTVSFPGGSLTGTVSFTMPATYYDGSAASGAFHYSVSVDGVEAVNGVEVAGGAVSCEITVAAAGEHKFEVICYNANGNSPKVKTRAFVGTDVPVAVGNVQATLADGRITVSWDAATGSVHGGYVDPAAVTYTVTRRPDGTVVASGISATSVELDAAVPDGELLAYTFEVTASYDGHTSDAAVSNSVVLGCFTPPHTWNFASRDDLAGTTVIDANNDGKAWTYDSYSKYMSVQYNSTLAMDDWFILAPLKLQAGYSYQLGYETKASSARYSEHLEVCLGTQATADAMTVVLTPRYEIVESDFTAKSVKFSVDADGTYFIGFHGCSDTDRNRLYLRNISVTAGAAPVAPQGVAGLTVTPDADGYNKATIAFTAPERNVDGSALSSCDIVIRRGEETVATLEGVEAGAARSYVDEPATGGTYTYSVVPVANGIEGETATATVFIGLKAPQPVTGVGVNETASDGEVTVTWQAPETDAEGNPFNSSLVRYNVYYFDGINQAQLVGEKLAECTFTHRVNDGSVQDLALYAVEAVTDGGTAAMVASEALAVGKAYPLPYADSFAPGADFIYGTRSLNGTNQWMTLNDATVDIISSVDDDDAFLAVQQSGTQACGEFFTGKIAMADMAAPVLSFYTFNTLDDQGQYPNMNTIQVMVRADGSWHEAAAVVVAETGAFNRWNKVFVPLADYTGKNIQVALRVTCNTYLLTVIDALRIGAETADNLAVTEFSFPGEVFAGADTHFDVTVDNRGMNRAASFDVSLLVDGVQTVARTVAEGLDAGQKTRVTFIHRFDAADNEAHTVEARVTMDGDMIADDNTSGVMPLAVDPSVFPAATSLTAQVAEGKVALAWSAPDMATVRPDAVTEDFEGYEAFDRNPAGWTMIDLDDAPVGGFRNITLPGIQQGSKQSFWVSEASEEVFGDVGGTFLGHNSLKYLMQLYVTGTDADGNTVACDDWAISPMLYGCKQTVGLWARSYSAAMPESFELLWSDGSLDPADFVSAAVFREIPAVWRHYAVQLPEGARRLAVRCISKDRFSFMADDVAFIPAEGPSTLTLQGYDIYCDGELLGTSAEPSFDAPLPATDGVHIYTVGARYDRGVAPLSAPATIDYSGIDGTEMSGVSVSTLPGLIVVTGAAGRAVSVANAAGMTVASVTDAPARLETAVAPGIYLVTVDGLTHKVAVQ